MDLGTISSWVAAGIAVLTYGLTVFRSWWNRTVADWSIDGEVRHPHQTGDFLSVTGKLSNLGDGNAHRVSVTVQRAPELESQVVATSPLLKPGDDLECRLNVHVEDWDKAEVWVKWTPPPMRRRREQTSVRYKLSEYIKPSEGAQRKLKAGPDSPRRVGPK